MSHARLTRSIESIAFQRDHQSVGEHECLLSAVKGRTQRLGSLEIALRNCDAVTELHGFRGVACQDAHPLTLREQLVD
jgi:hypothetical protein